MALTAYPNSLSFSDIETEFGGLTGPPVPPATRMSISLSNYYSGGNYVPANTSNAYGGSPGGAIPSGGNISVGDFHGSQKYVAYQRSAIGPITPTPVYRWETDQDEGSGKSPAPVTYTGPVYPMDARYDQGFHNGWLIRRYENNVLIETINQNNQRYFNTKPVTISNPHPVNVDFYLRFEFGVMCHQNFYFEAYDITGQTWTLSSAVGTLLYSSPVLGGSTTSGPLTGNGQGFTFNSAHGGAVKGTVIPQNLTINTTIAPNSSKVFMGRMVGVYNGDYGYYTAYYTSGLVRAVYGSTSAIIY